ncbi:hypothetical protein DdX_20131 [Ditylenchus destructor]|uniref:Secreted protein n=1 Tax=Ditylenchus destructor TaxID=166010 RepID=A0AAD4MGU2_9BILA|nr:hypothetical protein DdX_20131 [Ditylenchus destructor]
MWSGFKLCILFASLWTTCWAVPNCGTNMIFEPKISCKVPAPGEKTDCDKEQYAQCTPDPDATPAQGRGVSCCKFKCPADVPNLITTAMISSCLGPPDNRLKSECENAGGRCVVNPTQVMSETINGRSCCSATAPPPPAK